MRLNRISKVQVFGRKSAEKYWLGPSSVMVFLSTALMNWICRKVSTHLPFKRGWPAFGCNSIFSSHFVPSFPQPHPKHSFAGGPSIATLFGAGGAKMPKVAGASASTAASFGKAAPGAKLQLTAAAPKGQPMGKPFFVQTGPVVGIH